MLPRHFFAFPAMRTFSTWLGFIIFATALGGVVDRPDVEPVGAQHHDIGLLAGRERADLVIDIGAARALQRRELQHVAAGEQRRRVLFACRGGAAGCRSRCRLNVVRIIEKQSCPTVVP